MRRCRNPTSGSPIVVSCQSMCSLSILDNSCDSTYSVGIVGHPVEKCAALALRRPHGGSGKLVEQHGEEVPYHNRCAALSKKEECRMRTVCTGDGLTVSGTGTVATFTFFLYGRLCPSEQCYVLPCSHKIPSQDVIIGRAGT